MVLRNCSWKESYKGFQEGRGGEVLEEVRAELTCLQWRARTSVILVAWTRPCRSIPLQPLQWAIACSQNSVTRIAVTSKSLSASGCNRNSRKSLRLLRHPQKPTTWTLDPPVKCRFESASDTLHIAGNPQNTARLQGSYSESLQCLFGPMQLSNCEVGILLQLLQAKLATSKFRLPIASDLCHTNIRTVCNRAGPI